MSFTGKHYDILLGQMLKNQSVMQYAVQKLQSSFFRDSRIGGTISQALLFDVFTHYYARYKSMPDQAVVLTEVADACNRFTNDQALRNQIEYDVRTFYALVDCIDERSVSIANEIIKHMVTVCVLDQKRQDVLAEAMSRKMIDGLGQVLVDLESERKSLDGGATNKGFGFTTLHDGSERFKLHIEYLDRHFGDGAGPVGACCMAIIAPQGGGKTTHGIQMAAAQCLQGKNVLLVMLEEGYCQTVVRNIKTAFTGISTKELEASNDDPIEAAKRLGLSVEETMAKLKKLDDHLEILDLVANPGGIDKIEAEILRMKMSGKPAAMVYVDWAGLLAEYIMSNQTPGGRKYETKEQAVKAVGDQLSRIASQTKTFIVVSQQMAPVKAQQGATATYDQFCAADCKGFTQSMKYCLVLSKADAKTGVQKLTIAKARNDRANHSFFVRLEGAMVRFIDASDYTQAGGKRIQKTGARAGALPQEAR